MKKCEEQNSTEKKAVFIGLTGMDYVYYLDFIRISRLGYYRSCCWSGCNKYFILYYLKEDRRDQKGKKG